MQPCGEGRVQPNRHRAVMDRAPGSLVLDPGAGKVRAPRAQLHDQRVGNGLVPVGATAAARVPALDSGQAHQQHAAESGEPLEVLEPPSRQQRRAHSRQAGQRPERGARAGIEHGAPGMGHDRRQRSVEVRGHIEATRPLHRARNPRTQPFRVGGGHPARMLGRAVTGQSPRYGVVATSATAEHAADLPTPAEAMMEIDRVRSALSRAAVRTQQRGDGPPRTTRVDLAQWAKAHLGGRRLVVASNREPYSHEDSNGSVHVVRNAGGLTVALDAVMQALGGTWVAHGSGSADRQVVDEHDRVPCPPDRARYLLRRLWLSREDHERYYSGFSNAALWPLCHIAYVRPRFDLLDWQRYQDVNTRFAAAVLEEVADAPAFVFIQDYHLALAASTLREARPDLQIALFWHIPWPNAEVFRRLPWGREVLEGMLANDLVGFHIRPHALNFLETVAETLEARVDYERLAVERGGRRTWVRHFPIGVDAEEIGMLVDSPEVREQERQLRKNLGLGDCRIGLGVDRLDYTKGIPERLEALERLFEKHPEWVGRLAFVQIGTPSRIELLEYRMVMTRTREVAQRINKRFPRAGGPTVHLVEAHLDFRELLPYYRMADLCAVTALHDGMNLVAKEYVAASPDLEGALVLSPFTGAARELERAWIATPFDRDALADTYHAALSEPEAARRERMAALRETVLRRNIFDWTISVLDAAVGLELRRPPTEPVESPRTVERSR